MKKTASRNKPRTSRHTGRVVITNATDRGWGSPTVPRLNSLTTKRLAVDYLPSPSLSLIEDLRQWHPEQSTRPIRTFSGQPARLKVFSGPTRSGTRPLVPYSITFRNPQKTVVCVRRTQRKQVLHALGVAGRKGLKPRRRIWSSAISCR